MTNLILQDKVKLLCCALGIAIGMLTAGCATQRVQPHFQAPSVAPVKQAVTTVEQRLQGAQKAAAALDKECAAKSAGWQAAYDLLQKELSDAYLATQIAKERIDALDALNQELVGLANQVADDRDKQAAKSQAEHERGNKWLKLFLYASGLLVAAGAWILRKPLMLAAGIGL